MEKNLKIDITLLCEVAHEAGKKIMEVYQLDNFEVKWKEDNSPVTKADLLANQTIEKYLHRYFDYYPILSEEGNHTDFDERKNWEYYWCVDPLDGTKEFIKRTGEFTVNIAFIENNYPIIGVIHAPVLKQTWFAINGESFQILDGKNSQIHVNTDFSEGLIAIKSRYHLSKADEIYYSKYNIKELQGMGSSLKFCKIADGSAHIYRRVGPTMEWDLAAGQAILEGAGGYIFDDNNQRFRYNKEDLLNPSFVCLADKSLLIEI